MLRLKDILKTRIIESNVKVGNIYVVHGYPLLKGLFPNKYYKIDSIQSIQSIQRIHIIYI